MRTISLVAAAGALGVGMPALALAQAPAPGTPTQAGAWGRQGWVPGTRAPAAAPEAADTPPMIPGAAPAAAAPPAPVVVPTPGSVRAGPNSVVTTTITPASPPAQIGGMWNGGKVVAVTPGYVVTTTTRTFEPIARSVRASHRGLVRR